VKQLILFRHAKSSWDDDVGDVDRELAGRGERDAPRMGKRLKARHAHPELIVSSHAARAQRTAELVAKALGIKRKEIRIERALYMASPDDILGVVAAQDDSLSCVLLVGHNPGLTELVNRLLPDLALDNLPTRSISRPRAGATRPPRERSSPTTTIRRTPSSLSPRTDAS